MKELIKGFVDVQEKILTHILHNEVDQAKARYHDLLAIYNKINESDLEYFHKELAHEQISSVHSDLVAAEKTSRIPVNVIVAGVLVVVFSFLIFINPSIVGLITFEDEVTQVVGMSFAESTITSINLKDVPLSLSATGNFSGDVKLFYKVGDELMLIFDSSASESGSFEKVCDHTCTLKADSNVVELFAQVGENSVLNLRELVYTVARDDNRAPVWKSKTKEFVVHGKYDLDLDQHFEDPDGDELVYLSTSDDGLKVTVSNNLVTIVPESGVSGKRYITAIASDLDKLTKVPLVIDVR